MIKSVPFDFPRVRNSEIVTSLIECTECADMISWRAIPASCEVLQSSVTCSGGEAIDGGELPGIVIIGNGGGSSGGGYTGGGGGGSTGGSSPPPPTPNTRNDCPESAAINSAKINSVLNDNGENFVTIQS